MDHERRGYKNTRGLQDVDVWRRKERDRWKGWMERKTNEGILQMVDEEIPLLETIRRRERK